MFIIEVKLQACKAFLMENNILTLHKENAIKYETKEDAEKVIFDLVLDGQVRRLTDES